ncbi:MAG: hypothetical protein KAU22_11265, partial [Desulfuromonadales bacterium]|nr:hypothetical protein [Desulfuromonadales bacterium]
MKKINVLRSKQDTKKFHNAFNSFILRSFAGETLEQSQRHSMVRGILLTGFKVHFQGVVLPL